MLLVSILHSGSVLKDARSYARRMLSAHKEEKGLGLFDDVSVKHSWPSDLISHFRKSTREEQTRRKTQTNVMQNPSKGVGGIRTVAGFETIFLVSSGKI